jgi:hypothetical protein
MNITHIYPKMPFVLKERDAAGNLVPEPPPIPISNEREGDVWDELREFTFGEEPGYVYVLTHDEYADGEEYFRKQLAKDDVVMSRVQFAPVFEIEHLVTKDGTERRVKEPYPCNLGVKACANWIIGCYRGKPDTPITALVLMQPEIGKEVGSDYLKHLPMVAKACPDLPIYIFHDYYMNKYGVQREGDTSKSWQNNFHTKTEALAVSENVDVVVRGLCNVGSISMWGALPKHGKSYLFLSIMKALLSGEPWLGYFEVSPAKRVVYLVPEVGLRGVMNRLRKLGMVDYLFDPLTNPDGCLYVQTLSSTNKLHLDDKALLLAVHGADVFVDPIIRYIEGEENNASDQRILSNKLLALISAEARSVWCAHHSPKAFRDVTDITTQNVLRGTGEFAAFPDIIFGVLKTDDEASRLYIKCTDARDDDEYLGDFEVEMRPWIDETGDLKLIVPPGTGTPLREQKKEDEGAKRKKALELLDEGKLTRDEICKLVRCGTHKLAKWNKERQQKQMTFDTNHEGVSS